MNFNYKISFLIGNIMITTKQEHKYCKLRFQLLNGREVINIQKQLNRINEEKEVLQIQGPTYSITINEYYSQNKASELIRMIKTGINIFRQRLFCLIGDEKELLLILRSIFKHVVFANRVKLCNMEYQRNKCIVFHVTERCSYNKLMDGIYAWISGILDPIEQKSVVFMLSEHEPIQEYEFDAHYKYLFRKNVLTYNCRRMIMDIPIEQKEKKGIMINSLLPIDKEFPTSPTLPEVPNRNNQINTGCKNDDIFKSRTNQCVIPLESELLPIETVHNDMNISEYNHQQIDIPMINNEYNDSFITNVEYEEDKSHDTFITV